MADPEKKTPRPDHLEHAEESGETFEKRGGQIMNYDLSPDYDPPVDPPPGSDD
jgi:hypothetical protein